MSSKLITALMVVYFIVFVKSISEKYTKGLIYHGCAKNRVTNQETGGTSIQQSIYFRSLDPVKWSDIEAMCTHFLGSEASMLRIETLDEFQKHGRSLMDLNVTSIWTGIEWNPDVNAFQLENGVRLNSEWDMILYDDEHLNSRRMDGAKIVLSNFTSNNPHFHTAFASEAHFAICEMIVGTS